MRALIVGTAGHIDHGKSALVKALTGTDPDRLKEEKERGITIELGFAHADLGGGRIASFIDVPGHERFVRHMLAGAHGIDVVVLVVAADESVMPQTREHFHICRLLGITRGIVALTKCDAADEDMQAIAELEVRELVAGSFLEGAPVLRVSARTGAGLDVLRASLRDLADGATEMPCDGVLRLPIDRAFTLRGFGSVVTGTLRGGRLRVGDEVEVQPAGLRSRVRGLHLHGAAVDEVRAGSRAAVNLTGVEVGQLRRGDVVGAPDVLRPTSMIDVELVLLDGGKALADQARVRVHAATAEVLGRVRVLGATAVEPGGRALAQLRLESKVVVGRGDRLVLRSYSPADTIGGAVVLDPLPPRRRARQRASADAVGGLTVADPAAVAVRLLDEAGERGLGASVLAARLTVPVARVRELLAGRADVLAAGDAFLATSAVAPLAARTEQALKEFHAREPLRREMPREELRTRVFARAPAEALEAVLRALGGRVRTGADGVALAGHEVRLSGDEDTGRRVLLDAAREAGVTGVDVAALALASGRPRAMLDRVARVLQVDGRLCRVGDVLVDRTAVDDLKARVRERFPPGSKLEVGAFKDMTGLSRKFVIPLLELLDRERVTRRVGTDRVVLGA